MYSSSLSCFLIIPSLWTVRFGYHDYTSSGAGLPSSPVRLLFLPFFFFNSQRRKKCFCSSCQCLVTRTPFCPPHSLSSFFCPWLVVEPQPHMIWLLHTPRICSPHHESSISLFHTLWSSEPTPSPQLQIIPVRPLLLRRPARLPFTSLLISGIEVFPFFSCKLSSLVQRSLSILFGFSQNLYSESCKVS